MKIVTVVGARPQFIKEAVLCKEIQNRPDIEEILVHTGQHYDENMSGIFFDVLAMKQPDYNLNIGSGSHSSMTGKIMIAFEEVVMNTKPDVIAVYGDTNSTVAAALVAAKLHIPLAHIEAGLRQSPKDMPEEINRNQLVNKNNLYEYYKNIQQPMDFVKNLYGDGSAAYQMIDILEAL